MPLAVYFIGDAEDEPLARSAAAVFINRCEDYSPLERAIPGRKALVLINDPGLFERLDAYMCGHGLYDKGDVNFVDDGDSVRFCDVSDAVVFTDNLNFARWLKKMQKASL